ncbi:EamA family transporter [Streptomyces sp. NPDC048106]|uniref:EamA family transporter n=1 Tax=Streptomyces sp. NPDC048106 TaxID=3155750 RepID=UPI0034534859
MILLLGLCSSLLWGIADFAGGRLSRRLATYSVIFVAQSAALAGSVVMVLTDGSTAADWPALAWGAGAGCAGVVALGSFYRALAIGRVSLVAPVSATSVALPVLIGVVQGQAPAPLQSVGLALAALGTVLAVAPELPARGTGTPAADTTNSRASLGLALLASAGFGLVLVAIAAGSRHDVHQTLLGQRGAYVGIIAVILLAVTARGGAVTAGWGRGSLAVAVLVGLGDMAANLMYALSARSDLLPVVSVLASLYPVVTVVLAGWLDRERLRPAQVFGVVGTFAGVALIGIA